MGSPLRDNGPRQTGSMQKLMPQTLTLSHLWHIFMVEMKSKTKTCTSTTKSHSFCLLYGITIACIINRSSSSGLSIDLIERTERAGNIVNTLFMLVLVIYYMLNKTTTQRNCQLVNSSPLMATAVKRQWDEFTLTMEYWWSSHCHACVKY